MNEMTVFQNPDFGQVRTVTRDGEPWFVAADVCRALELGNNRQALKRLDDDEKGVISTDTLGGEQKMNIVNEPGLYSLVLGSRKPEARAFKRWITHDVIPAIRKTGSYSVKPDTITIDVDTLKTIVGATVEETLKRVLPLMRPEPVAQEAPVKRLRKRNPLVPVDFSEVLNKVIKERNMTGTEIARRLGVSNATVSSWRNGEWQPNSKNLIQFSLQFNIPMSELARGIF